MTAIRYVRGTLPGIPGEHDIAVLEGDTHISKWVEESGRLDHDQNTLPRIGKLITPESVVWDVGAFIGDHTAFYASRARQVVAFEGIGDAYLCLDINTKKYTNVTTLCCFIGDGASVGDIVTNENKGARYITSNGALSAPGPKRSVMLDEAQHSVLHTIPTLIKLDIEGWEVRALRGAKRTLREHHPIIVCEVNRHALERAGTSAAELHETLWLAGYHDMRDIFTEERWEPSDQRPQFDIVAR